MGVFRKKLKLIAALALAAAMATGCAEAIPQTPQAQPIEQFPALDGERFEAIKADLAKRLTEADQASSVEPLGYRIGGIAKQMRQAQYSHGNASAIPMEVKSTTVTNSPSWPRAIITVTASEDGKNVYVLALTQADAKQQYALTNWAKLLPKQSFPATMKLETGGAPISPDSTDYVVNPNEVVSEYAKMLSGSESKLNADNLADSPVTTRLNSDKSDLQSQMEDAGDVSVTYEAADTPVVTIALADGSALVMGAILVTTQIDKSGNRIIEVKGEVGDVLGDGGKVTSKAVWKYAVPVVFVVPSAQAVADAKADAQKAAEDKADGEKDQEKPKESEPVKINMVAADRVLLSAERP